MKKRNLWKAALTLCLIGAFCLLLSFFLAGGTRKAYAQMLSDNDKRNQFTEEAFETEEIVRELNVTDSIYGISIAPSSDGKTHIRYTQSEYDGYEITLTDGSLRVKYVEDMPQYFWFSFSLTEPDRTVQIELPTEALERLFASCVSGNLTAKDMRTSGDTTLETINGEIRASGMTVDGNFTATNTNGGTRITKAEAAGAIYADTVNGQIDLEDFSSGGAFRAETTNGAITVMNGRSKGAFSAETVNGSIRLTNVSGESFALSSVNGDIRATLSGKAAQYAWNTAARADQTPVTTSTINGSVEIEYAE